MNISIGLKGSKNNKIGKIATKRILENSIIELSAFARNRAVKNIRSTIYANAPSLYYTRTGRALGGFAVNKKSDTEYAVIGDTRLKMKMNKPNSFGYIPPEPKGNYMPYLNRNKRVRKLDSRFWDNMVKETQKEAEKTMRTNLKREFK